MDRAGLVLLSLAVLVLQACAPWNPNNFHRDAWCPDAPICLHDRHFKR